MIQSGSSRMPMDVGDMFIHDRMRQTSDNLRRSTDFRTRYDFNTIDDLRTRDDLRTSLDKEIPSKSSRTRTEVRKTIEEIPSIDDMFSLSDDEREIQAMLIDTYEEQKAKNLEKNDRIFALEEQQFHDALFESTKDKMMSDEKRVLNQDRLSQEINLRKLDKYDKLIYDIQKNQDNIMQIQKKMEDKFYEIIDKLGDKLNDQFLQMSEVRDQMKKDRAQMDQDRAQMKKDRAQIDKDRDQMNKDRVHVEEDRTQVDKVSSQLKMLVDQMEKNRFQMEKDRAQMEKDRAQMEKDRAQVKKLEDIMNLFASTRSEVEYMEEVN